MMLRGLWVCAVGFPRFRLKLTCEMSKHDKSRVNGALSLTPAEAFNDQYLVDGPQCLPTCPGEEVPIE